MGRGVVSAKHTKTVVLELRPNVLQSDVCGYAASQRVFGSKAAPYRFELGPLDEILWPGLGN